MTGYVPPCSPLPRRRHNDLTDSPKTTYGETQHDTNAAWRAPMAQRRSRLDQLDRVMTLPWAEYFAGHLEQAAVCKECGAKSVQTFRYVPKPLDSSGP